VDRGELRTPIGLLGAAEAVEDVELRGGERQLAVLVLAVEGQQRATDVAQFGRRGAAAVQVGPGTPFGAHAPGEHELLRVAGDPLTELGAQLGAQLEDALDVRLGGARAHDARARLAAQQQVERVREHGLARARLAREHVEPGPEPQLGPLDQQEVLDTQLFQHA
jgi:hypothetical protein